MNIFRAAWTDCNTIGQAHDFWGPTSRVVVTVFARYFHCGRCPVSYRVSRKDHQEILDAIERFHQRQAS